MFKKKALVFIYSCVISFIMLLLFIFIDFYNGFHIDDIKIETFWTLGYAFTYYVSIFLIFGVPINLASSFITEKIKRRSLQTLVHLLIHISTGYIIGQYILQIPGFIVAFCASVVFVFDQLIVYNKKALWVISVPFILAIGTHLYFFIPNIEYNMVQKRIHEQGFPEIHLQFAGQTYSDLKGNYCYSSQEGCSQTLEPSLLPLGDIGILELDRSKGNTVRIHTKNIPVQNPTIYLYYLYDEQNTIKVNIKDNKFLIPSHIPDQIMVIEIIWNNEKYISYFGIRSPERSIGQ